MPLGLCSLFLLLVALAQPAHRLAAQPHGDLAGRLLVATPEMQDPRFVQSVIYIVRHDREGTLGLIVNRPLLQAPMEDVAKSFGVDATAAKGEVTVHYGGPVGPRQGFILHSDEVVLESSTRVKDGIAMTAEPSLIAAISAGKGPRQFLFTLGYSGWAAGQLQGEIQNGSWFIIAADREMVFGKQSERKWQRAMDRRPVRL